jgi:hypothetical protein
MQLSSAGSYCILEHFADNPEEIELSTYGMMLWGNMNYNFNEATMGYVSTSNFSGAIAQNRGWSKNHLVAYQESHDEERLMYKNLTFGNQAGGFYDARALNTALARNGMAAAFWAMIPGPKMLWQFGELGYDVSITACANGSVPTPYPSGTCRLDSKPAHWDYYSVAARKGLFDVYSKLFRVRNTSNYLSTFTSGTQSWDLGGAFKVLQVGDDSLKVVVIGNFDVTSQTGSVTFPTAGTWYSVLTGGTRAATGTAQSITLQPGEYYVYTNKDLSGLVVTGLQDIRPGYGDNSIFLFPNPVASEATLALDLPVSGKLHLTVYDMLGRVMGSADGGTRMKGKNILSLDALGLSAANWRAGHYILVADINGRRMKRQFVVMH